MNRYKENIISRIIANRNLLIETVFIAIVFGVIVNLISTFIGKEFSDNQQYILLLALIFVVLIWTWIRFSGHLLEKQIFSGVVAIDSRGENNFINLLLYSFPQDLHRLMSIGFKGDEKLLDEWRNGIIDGSSTDILHGPGFVKQIAKPKNISKQNSARSILVEAAEIHVLNLISDSLKKFSKNKSDINLYKLNRDDISLIIPKNRIFNKILTNKDNSGVLFQQDSRGFIYFDPVFYFPKDFSFSKKNNFLEINTKRIRVGFRIDFEGSRRYESQEFCEFYINKSAEFVNLFSIDFHVEVEVKRRSIYDFGSWWEADWVKVLLEDLEKSIDFDRFKRDVGFESALFMLRVNQVLNYKINGGK